MVFDFETEAATSGTCLQGYALATRQELIQIFGEPNESYLDDKCNFEWSLLFTNPKDSTDTIRATIYDWKCEPGNLSETISWHIGGDGLDAVHCVAGHLLAHREKAA